MTIPLLNATSLQMVLHSGRTRPCVFFCEDTNGKSNGEYVVKLKAGMESGVNGLAFELIASQLATILDVPVPEAAIIELDPVLAEIIADTDLSRKIKESSGLNFGSKVITGGFETWPVGKAIPSALKTLAAEIFSFDALIQNPDRRADKPNILWKGDELYIIDHEMGFSFIYEVLPEPNPWHITKLGFMRNHLFHEGLKGQTVNLDRFAGALELLSDNVLESIMANVPEEWQNDNLSRIGKHIHDIIQHVNDFVDEVRRSLQ